jgi:collagen type III alpha
MLILLSVLACTQEDTTPSTPAATAPVTEPAPAAEEKPDLDPVQSELSENAPELEAPKLGEGSSRSTTGGPSLGGPPSFGGGGSMGGAPSLGGPPRLGGAPQLGGAPTLGGGPPKLGGSSGGK